MKENIVSVQHITKKVKRRYLLQGIQFQIEKGEICGLLGPNGAGKTTLLRVLTGLIQPDEGDVFIQGNSVIKNRQAGLSEIGAIIENPIFFPYMTGRENLFNLALLHSQLTKQTRKEKVEEVLQIVQLEDRADDKVRTYSLGMKQRLGIAQALLGDPSLLVLDEPANGLDPMGIRELRELILRLNEEFGMTILISSHLLDEIQRVCEQLVVIREGEVLWTGPMENLAREGQQLEDAFVELVSR
ncbi:ABC transporter ATP-binding protein [Oceanobacillus jeddahense]|uniref:ABC transporter ATP-binding protein n=1 Tax=Oceanobacillus jeddahense TaxID=1462527 RepID=UPI000595A8EB|nr:ATP-binding cassette domain-containing protein [Oceanobacillus jeddahense]